jgi:hypothetical protein
MLKRGLLCFAATLFGCSAHVTSNLTVDGAPFPAASCRSGETSGFPGVELADVQGRRLRLAQNVDGTLAAAYFSAGSASGENLNACGTVSIQRGFGVVNGARNLEGSATLACRTEKHQVQGTVRFENCH